MESDPISDSERGYWNFWICAAVYDILKNVWPIPLNLTSKFVAEEKYVFF